MGDGASTPGEAGEPRERAEQPWSAGERPETPGDLGSRGRRLRRSEAGENNPGERSLRKNRARGDSPSDLIPAEPPTRQLTPLERAIDRTAHRLLAGRPNRGVRAVLIEVAIFLLKQAWACVFGALMLVVIVAARLWYPDDAVLARNDAMTIAAVAIQIGMLVGKLESGRELWVIVLFHATGTVMELFKTDVGSWAYAADGVLRLGAVPLFSGFMYAAVGSYMVRVYRLHDLRFTRYPPIWATTVVAVAIYANFFTHHYVFDARWILLAAVGLLWCPTMMHFRIWRATLKVPLLPVFLGVAVFIWIAENIATLSGAWLYPNQTEGWEFVSGQKIISWLLLMIISVVMVTWVYRPRRPDAVEATHER